jgi:hypothetical protein
MLMMLGRRAATLPSPFRADWRVTKYAADSGRRPASAASEKVAKCFESSLNATIDRSKVQGLNVER